MSENFKLEYAKVVPNNEKGEHPVVVVERVHPFGIEPDYCVHGRTRCFCCNAWCNLGTDTYQAVMAGAHPICLECAKKMWESFVEQGIEPPQPDAHLTDHLRADGPHE